MPLGPSLFHSIGIKNKTVGVDSQRIAFILDKDTADEKTVSICNFDSKEVPGISACLEKSKQIVTGEVANIEKIDNKSLSFTYKIPGIGTLENSILFVCKENINYLKMEVVLRDIVSRDSFEIFFNFNLCNTEKPFFMIPGVLYGTNNERISKGIQPMLTYRSKSINLPRSHSWHFRSDRSPLPFSGAFYNQKVFCAGIDEVHNSKGGSWGYNSLGLWTSEEKGDRVSVAIGCLDWPARLLEHKYSESEATEEINTGKGNISSYIYLYWDDARDRFCFEDFMKVFYCEIHDLPRIVVNREQALLDIVNGTMESVNPKTGFFNSRISGKEIQSTCDTSYIGILQIAQPLLESAIVCGDNRTAEYARGVINRVVNEAINEKSNLFFDAYSEEEGWRSNRWGYGYEHSAYINGQACYFIIKAYQREKARGIDNPKWLLTAQRVLKQVTLTQGKDGHFGINFASNNGSVIDYQGFAGCWFVAPLVMLYSEKQKGKWALKAALKAVDAYYHDLKTMELLGSPMETYKAPDEEGILSFIKGLVELHKLEKDKRYLEMLSHALHYNFTFKFAYNTHHTYNQICNWSSSGGDLTDTHNIHIHAYGNIVADEIYYYYQQTGDSYFYDRLKDTILWGLQAYNHYDKEFGYGKKGWITEQFYHTYVDYHGGGRDGGIWPAFLPWANGAIMSSLAGDIPGDIINDMVKCKLGKKGV